MIYTDKQIQAKLLELIESFEDEVVEFKEANNGYSFRDIGKYFSALGNEANIRDKKEGWLVFGVANNRAIVGSNYRKGGNLQSLKKEIRNGTNENMTFLEIYETFLNGKRIVAFQIPPATRGIPTTWNGAAYAREDESTCALPLDKMDLIRSQIGVDWSKEIVPSATMDDLDEQAVTMARELFLKKQKALRRSTKILEDLPTEELFNKAGLFIKGQVTNTALILLGKEESYYLFDGLIPRITWTLYNGDGSPKAYEHFNMPLLLSVDRAYAKIRNEKYRYIAAQQTLFPDEVDQYDPEVIKEILNNCIAHSNYQLRGKINIEEFEDHLVFINEGNFIPETVERALEKGYKPPYYRNTFLCNAMVNLYMIDTNAMGIPMIYQIQRDKCFPLPTYNLEDPNRVEVTLYGKILDKNYTQLLYQNGDLDLMTVFLLDKIQKREVISKGDAAALKRRGLVEGRYPRLIVSYKVANMVGKEAEYVIDKGLSNEKYRQLIINALETMGEASASQLKKVLEGALPGYLEDDKKQTKKVSNILQAMKKEGTIDVKGTGHNARWFLA